MRKEKKGVDLSIGQDHQRKEIGMTGRDGHGDDRDCKVQ